MQHNRVAMSGVAPEIRPVLVGGLSARAPALVDNGDAPKRDEPDPALDHRRRIAEVIAAHYTHLNKDDAYDAMISALSRSATKRD